MVTEMRPGLEARDEPPWRRDGFVTRSAQNQMVAGLLIMAVGMALLLGRIGILQPQGLWRHFWPLLFISLGLGKLLTPRPDGRRHGGGWLLIGVWLLLSELHIWRATESWPLFLVAFGIKLVWDAVMVSARRPV